MAAKAGAIALTLAMATKWGRYKVNVNCEAFGMIKTRLTEAPSTCSASIDIEGREIRVGVSPDLLAMMERGVPLGRGGTPEEAAGSVYLPCTPESNYINGQTLVCGGGMMI